jgi:SAM-dependent methyltransferase
MDIFTALNREAEYSKSQLQLILGAWVMSSVLEKNAKVSVSNGHVEEGEYDKRSIYSLLYALYRTMGTVVSDNGESYEFTFNTWGYAWPKSWGTAPNSPRDPQRFGRNAYSGLYHFDAVKKYVANHGGKVHVVEMGCGTGAGAHHVCSNVLPQATYEAVDMQMSGIGTCRRKFVPQLAGRLKATCADATRLPIADGVADFVAVNETHVTEFAGQVTAEDRAFFSTAYRLLKPGGFLVWGNAIPASTWAPSIDYLESMGMKLVERCDVTKEAVQARDEDKGRIDAYARQCIEAFHGFRIPWLGAKKRIEADQALKNFARNPGTKLYDTMVDGSHTYEVVAVQKN